MDPSARVSVAIVNWNTRELLRACLESLRRHGGVSDLEVIVVDNGSSDGSVEMVRDEFPEVRLIANGENRGFVQANNQGLAAATGDYLFMLNSDAEVRPGAIARLVAALADPRRGAAGPRLLNSDGTIQGSASLFPRMIHRFIPEVFERRYHQRLAQRAAASPASEAEADWLSGAALMTRRDVLARVGPLDERYYMWYDDLDWARKLQCAGYQRVLVDDAEVVHHGRQSGQRLASRELQEQLFDSEYLYLRLNDGLPATWMAYGLRVAKALLKLVGGGAAAREESRARLAYHRRRFRRFCLEPVPRPGAGPQRP